MASKAGAANAVAAPITKATAHSSQIFRCPIGREDRQSADCDRPRRIGGD